MPKPSIVDLPYPDLSGIEKDLKSAVIIAPAYASMHGELNAILQYLYHYFIFKELGEEKTAKTLISIAVAEMHHLRILGETLTKLGVNPVYTKMPPLGYNYYNTAGVCYSRTPMKMIIDDISGEILAVKSYEKMLSELKNEGVLAIIKRITLDEELHIKILKDCLKELGGESIEDFEG